MRANNARVYAPYVRQNLPRSLAGISFGRFAVGVDASGNSILGDSVLRSFWTPSADRFLLCPCSRGFFLSGMICVVHFSGGGSKGSASSSRTGQSSRSMAVSKM